MTTDLYRGEQGYQGYQGVRGYQGTTGRGLRGYQGYQGIGGEQGHQGATGNGEQGAQGFQGIAGTGNQGAQGFQGATGTGDQGAQGFQGATGTGSQGAQGFQGLYGGDSLHWTFSSTTTNADPGSGNLRLNNATMSLVTFIWVSETAGGGVAAANFFEQMANGDIIKVTAATDSTRFGIWVVGGLPFDSGTWRQVSLTSVLLSGSFTNGETVVMTYSRKGATGSQGAQGEPGPEPAWGDEDPSNFTATFASDTQINLAWDDNADFENHYVIDRSLVGTSGPWTEINVTAANAESYNDTGLSPSTTYYYRLRGKFGPIYSSALTASDTTDAPPPSGGAFASSDWTDGVENSVSSMWRLTVPKSYNLTSATLTLDGQTSAPISCDADTTALQAALDATWTNGHDFDGGFLPTVYDGDIDNGGDIGMSAGNWIWFMKFDSSTVFNTWLDPGHSESTFT